MAAAHNDEFRRDTVRIVHASGLARRQVASDLGIGHSTLGKRVRMFSGEAKAPAQGAELLRENERLRKENRIFPEEREAPKKGGSVLRGSKAMKFQFIVDYRGSLARSRPCRLMGVTDRGSRAWKHRPLSHRQRRDMVLLAHIRDQHRQGPGSYGRPRMTAELIEPGLRVGLMRQNGIQVIRGRKLKRTTDSDRSFNIAPSLCSRTSQRAGRTRSGLAT